MPLVLSPSYPANLTQPCDPLPAFDGATADDLIGYTLSLTSQYRDCSTRHAALAKAVQ